MMAGRRSPLGEAIFAELWLRGDETIIPTDVIRPVLDHVPFSVVPRNQQARAVDYMLGRVRSVLHASKDSWGDRRWVFIPEYGGWRRFAGLGVEEVVLVTRYRQGQTDSMVRASDRLSAIRNVMETAARQGATVTVEEAQTVLAQ